jgi:hypothetical protein
MGAPAPTLNFGLVDLTGGYPIQRSDAFEFLLEQATSGGDGTGNYLSHFARFSELGTYLQKTGDAAYSQVPGPGNGQRLTASTNGTSLHIDVTLDPQLHAQDYDGQPIVGMATITMELPDPYDIVKIAVFGVQLAEIPPGFVVTGVIWQALFKPILARAQNLFQSLIESWLDMGEGEAADLGEAIADTAADAAEAASEDVGEVIAEEAVVAELAIDFAAAVPALAAVGILVAIPILIELLAKKMSVHIQVNNMTNTDFNWSIAYTDEGAVSVQPKSATIPKMSTVTDIFGDTSSVLVVHQADLSFVNTSGFEGIGFVLNFAPADNSSTPIAAVISIPFFDDNSAWLGDPGANPDWGSLYGAHEDDGSGLAVSYGNRDYTTNFAFDALSGNNDDYHCILRIQEL